MSLDIITFMTELKELSSTNFHNPTVSISCITYNHQNYISKTLDGFLSQRINYPVEILIHDDASTDNTPYIIQQYAKEYPHIIKPIYQTINRFQQGYKSLHYEFNISRSNGHYVAICEGDDHWIDTYKLYKQINYLKNNHEYTLCTHDVYRTSIKYNNNLRSFISILYNNISNDKHIGFINLCKALINKDDSIWNYRRDSRKAKVSTLSDLLKSYHIKIDIPTVSIVGIGSVLRSIPKELRVSTSGHKEIIFWSALHGKIGYLNEAMAIRNQQPSSLTITNLHKKHNNFDKYYVLEKFYSSLLKYSDENQKTDIVNAIHKMKNLSNQTR